MIKTAIEIIDYCIVLGPSNRLEAKEHMLRNQEKGTKCKSLRGGGVLGWLVKAQGLRFLTVKESWRFCMPSIMPSVGGSRRARSWGSY